MDKKTLLHAVVLLTGVFFGAVSQVLLKKAAMRDHASRIREYWNPLVILAYLIFLGTTFLSIYAYRGIPLSLGPVLEGTGYLYVTLLGRTIFHEKVTRKKIAALGLILSGITVYSLLG